MLTMDEEQVQIMSEYGTGCIGPSKRDKSAVSTEQERQMRFLSEYTHTPCKRCKVACLFEYCVSCNAKWRQDFQQPKHSVEARVEARVEAWLDGLDITYPSITRPGWIKSHFRDMDE